MIERAHNIMAEEYLILRLRKPHGYHHVFPIFFFYRYSNSGAFGPYDFETIVNKKSASKISNRRNISRYYNNKKS